MQKERLKNLIRNKLLIKSAQNGIMTIKNAHLCPDKDDIKSLGAKMQ